MPKLPLINKAYLMAERMGFEPMKELLLYTLSKRAPSTTRPSLLFFNFYTLCLILKYDPRFKIKAKHADNLIVF